IRDFHVTGVQTCTLPIFSPPQISLAEGDTVYGRAVEGLQVGHAQALPGGFAAEVAARHLAVRELELARGALSHQDTRREARVDQIGRASCRERGEGTGSC